METEFITPRTIWNDIGNIGSAGSVSGQENKARSNSQMALFTDVFKNAIDQVKETQADVENKQYLLSTGQLDDAHTLPIAEAKAALSLDMLISLRNKTIESYNELLKMNV